MRGLVTVDRNSWTHGHGIAQGAWPSAGPAITRYASACHRESSRWAYTRRFVSIAITLRVPRKSDREFAPRSPPRYPIASPSPETTRGAGETGGVARDGWIGQVA